MSKASIILASALALVVTAACLAQNRPARALEKPPLPIIPGAHGFGMETVAGSGRHLDVPKTTVIKVTNLNDKGTGPLRATLQAEGPDVVVFEVSGSNERIRCLLTHNRPTTASSGVRP